MGEYDIFKLIGLMALFIIFLCVCLYANLPTKWTLGSKEMDYAFIRDCELLSLKEPEMKKLLPANVLWENQRVLVMVVRRPGCLLCRREAKTLSFLKHTLDKAQVKLIAVVHEKFDVDQFRTYFAGEIYFDKERRFFGPKERWMPNWHSLLRVDTFYHLLRAKRAGIEGNSLGEARLLGGVYLLGKGDDGILFRHYERSYGDMVNIYKLMGVVMNLAMP
uniref:Peroxiredoxin-like 2A n=1 Tax=Plectus sambesii TaxID=2011161 RepID=A0A914X0T5_9BILA